MRVVITTNSSTLACICMSACCGGGGCVVLCPWQSRWWVRALGRARDLHCESQLGAEEPSHVSLPSRPFSFLLTSDVRPLMPDPPHPAPPRPAPPNPPPTRVAPNGDDATETQSPLSSSLTPSLPHRHNTHALCRKESQLSEQIVDTSSQHRARASAQPHPSTASGRHGVGCTVRLRFVSAVPGVVRGVHVDRGGHVRWRRIVCCP
jgi:hypothetical protein